MNAVGPETVLGTFLIFCRIGACLMLMPGFSSPRVPLQVRLFLAFATTLALTPILLPTTSSVVPGAVNAGVVGIVTVETAIGALIGLMGRYFFLALQFMASAVAMFIGVGGMPDTHIEDAEPQPAIATFITLTATVLFFVADLHWEVLRALVASYAAIPITEPLNIEFSLRQVTAALGQAFVLALQISAPFIVYTFVINLMFGIINKLTPQIPVYFISFPFIAAGGCFLLYFTIAEFLTHFTAGFLSWLIRG